MMISTSFKTKLVRLKPKIIAYRKTKNFNVDEFLNEIQNANFVCNTSNADANYDNLINSFSKIVDKHAPIKHRTLRGNQAPFMTRELRKAIYNRSRLKNRQLKNPSTENRLNYKKQRNKCVSLRKKAMKTYFYTITNSGIISNKIFWNTVKPFITNKSGLTNNDIMIIHNDLTISNESELTKLFNDHYINIVENSSGIKPEALSNIKGSNDLEILNKIKHKYKDHPSIKEIKTNIIETNNFQFHEIEENEVKNLLQEINPKKSTGEDKIPPKFVKLAREHLITPVTEAINSSIRTSTFPKNAKRAAVIPLDKGGIDKTNISNYRPVSVLNVFSKLYEKVIKNQITPFLDRHLSIFISAYRKRFSTQHVLLRLLEEWRHKLDKNYVVGAILMDLSKAFDCIPHELLIAKMSAYGFGDNALLYIMSYLKDRTQSTRINNFYSLFQLIVSGVPQGSILGPILFNLFLNDLFYFIQNANIHNYADDNTLSAFSNSIPNLIKILEEETNIAILWLNHNHMIANPEKFHSIIIQKSRKETTGNILNINQEQIESEPWVKLLGVKIDNKLNFDLHINDLCKKSSSQLNAIIRLSPFLNFHAKQILIQSFIYANFNYCPLVWHFSSSISISKVESIQKRALRFLYKDYESDYSELLARAGKTPMNVYRLRTLCTEVYKSINHLSPSYMANIFQPWVTERPVRTQNINNFKVVNINQTTFGTHSIKSLGPRIWNSLPGHLKSCENLNYFKEMIKNWDGNKCHCNICKNN